MIISILSLFPEVIQPFLNHSILKRASAKKLVQFNLVNWRDLTTDKHHTVDEHPYGGGAGMLLMIEPIVKAIDVTEKEFGPAHKIILSPQGQLWDQKKAKAVTQSSKIKHLMLICGHYEGFDERLLSYINEQVSIGNYVLSGGESAALVIVDSLVRLLPGVLKKDEATTEETFMSISKSELYQLTEDQEVLKEPNQTITLIEYPQYTKPENFQGKEVPRVLLSGNHAQINQWRLRQAWEKTKKNQKGR